MGQEERKNKAKLEKTQVQMASNSNEYENAVKTLEETTGRWNKEWKSACDKFQDLEEERLDFTKSSLWTYANIASTVCVSDDAVSLSLLVHFIMLTFRTVLREGSPIIGGLRSGKRHHLLHQGTGNRPGNPRSPALYQLLQG